MNFHNTISAAPRSYSLADKAMLGSVRIRQWSGFKIDKEATKQVTQDNHADANSGRFNKTLVSRDALAKIVTTANKARDEHYARTLPWHDNGNRILSAAGYLGYTEVMRTLRAEYEAAVSEFIAAYPDYVANAVKSLGDLYKPADYPSANELVRKFGFDVVITNLPDAADFRVDLSGIEADMIRADIERLTQDAIGQAMADVFNRVADAVGKMAEKLSETRATAKGEAAAIFRDSLVQNVRDLVDLLPSLNVTGDATLTAIAERMRAELCGFDADALRDDPKARKDVAKAAAEILASVNEYMQ